MTLRIIQILALSFILAMVSCKTNKLAKGAEETQEVATNLKKIIVDIQPDYSSEELAAEFTTYGLVPLSKTSRSLNAWLFNYNADSIEEEALLALLTEHEFVIKSRSFETAVAKRSLSPTISKRRLPVK